MMNRTHSIAKRLLVFGLCLMLAGCSLLPKEQSTETASGSSEIIPSGEESSENRETVPSVSREESSAEAAESGTEIGPRPSSEAASSANPAGPTETSDAEGSRQETAEETSAAESSEAETDAPEIVYPACESAWSCSGNMKVGWNLGLSFAYYNSSPVSMTVDQFETAWGRKKFTQSMMNEVAAQGFGMVRIQVSWINHIDSEGNIDPAWMDRLEQVVGYCMNAGLYCIINTTGATWMTAERAGFASQSVLYRHLWEQIAARFKDYGQQLLFESCNEVLYQGIWWNPPAEAYGVMADYYQIFVDTVRAQGGYNATRNLILNTYAATYDSISINNFRLPQDSVPGHLIAEVHCYEPNTFCFNETNLGSTNFTNEWGTAAEKARLDSIMAELNRRFIRELNIPVFIGEFGTVDRVPEAKRAEYVGYFASAATANGVKCILFDDAWDFAVFDRIHDTWPYPQIMDALMIGTGVKPAPQTPTEPEPTEPSSEPSELPIDVNGWMGLAYFTTAGGTYNRSDVFTVDPVTMQTEIVWLPGRDGGILSAGDNDNVATFGIEYWNWSLNADFVFDFCIDSLYYINENGESIIIETDPSPIRSDMSEGTGGAQAAVLANGPLVSDIREVHAVITLLHQVR